MRDELAAFKESLLRFLSAAGDLIVLNLLIILCCLPVVTAGAALTAGYATLLRILRGAEQGFPFRPFFADFRKSFRKATLAWLLLLLGLFLMAGDYYFAVYASEPVNRFFLVFSIVIAAVLLLAAMWLFPLIARFENTVMGHVKNAFLMAAGMFPRTLLAFVVQYGILLLPLFVPEAFIYLGWFWVGFGLSLPMYIVAVLFRKPLESEYHRDEEENEDESHPDTNPEA